MVDTGHGIVGGWSVVMTGAEGLARGRQAVRPAIFRVEMSLGAVCAKRRGVLVRSGCVIFCEKRERKFICVRVSHRQTISGVAPPPRLSALRALAQRSCACAPSGDN